MMMSFCKKSVHSFLSFANSKDNETLLNFSTPHHQHHRNFATTSTAATGGLALFTISNNIEKPANVVECAAIKSPPPTLSSSSSTTPIHTAATDMMTMMTSPTTTTTTATATDSVVKKDPGGIGFIDEVGGSVDGLMSCTESLGFESSDERRVDDHIEKMDHEKGLVSRETSSCRSLYKRKHVKREVKKFPPPLSSLDHDGRPTIYLHPVRKDGRLELTGVKVDRRPEILQASRENGRLRLHLIRDEEDEHIKEEEEQMQEIQENCEVVEEEPDQNDVKEKEEERVKRWKFPVASGGGGGDGFRRCNEVVSHHHHHHHHHRNLNVWRQHCLTIT